MFTASLISLPSETLQRLADEGPASPWCGGGDATERRVALTVAVVAAALAAGLALFV